MSFATKMAKVYAMDLKKRLEPLAEADIGFVDEPMTSFKHLRWMCQEIIDRKDFSDTKAHRWIGYIQGVMTLKQATSVDFERRNYVEVKKALAKELGIEDEPV